MDPRLRYEWVSDLAKASIMLHPNSEFHYVYFLSDVLLVSCFLSFAGACVDAPALASNPLMPMHHRYRTALPYY